MRSSGHLLRRAGRKLPRGTIWVLVGVLVAYAALAAILTLGVGFPLPWGLLGAGGLLVLVWVGTHPDDRHPGGAGAEAQYHGGGGVGYFGGGVGDGGGGGGDGGGGGGG
jgi:hypothetical protein